jgi:hypothetical protein
MKLSEVYELYGPDISYVTLSYFTPHALNEICS